MTANVALFDAGSGDLINALSTNHTAPPTVTCHFNTVKLPFPNKTLSGLPTPTNLLASVGTVDGWRPKSLVCASRSQQTEISRIHAPYIDHVFTPYVTFNACMHYRDACGCTSRETFVSLHLPDPDKEPTIDISPSLHVQNIGFFLLGVRR